MFGSLYSLGVSTVGEGACVGLLSHSLSSHSSDCVQQRCELKKPGQESKDVSGSTWSALEKTSSKPLVLKSSLCAWIIGTVPDLPLG